MAGSNYPFGKWWIGLIMFAAVWLAAYKFLNVIFI